MYLYLNKVTVCTFQKFVLGFLEPIDNPLYVVFQQSCKEHDGEGGAAHQHPDGVCGVHCGERSDQRTYSSSCIFNVETLYKFGISPTN